MPLSAAFYWLMPKLRLTSAGNWSPVWQQSNDAELETLRQQEIELRSQLELTTRKLENLTDIERQLSSRKPGGNFSSDAGHGGDKVPEVIHDDP